MPALTASLIKKNYSGMGINLIQEERNCSQHTE
jgi:hypothetical protein